MNRWIVALLVLLAVILLVSPAILGTLTNRSVEEGFRKAEAENPGIRITEERLDMGWFTTEGRYRVAFDGGQFREIAGEYTSKTGYPALFSMLIDTRIDHGLIPVTSMNRDGGSLSPGLSRSVSTFRIDRGDGNLIDIPGALYTSTALTGSSVSQLRLEKTSFSIADIAVDFDGADLDITANAAATDFTVQGKLLPWSLSADDGNLRVGETAVGGRQVRTEFGYYVGDANVVMDAISVGSPGGEFAVGSARIATTSAVDNGRLDSRGTFEALDVVVPGFGDADFLFRVSATGLDAAAAGTINKAIQEAQAADDPAAAFQSAWPDIEPDVEALAAAGGSIRIDEFRLAMPLGTILTDLTVEVPELDEAEEFSWATVLLRMTASVNVRVPAQVLEMAAMATDQAAQLIAMGILVRDGDDYVLAAQYAQGLINVNGAPMPIPLPLLQ